jgi:hypothetical protein
MFEGTNDVKLGQNSKIKNNKDCILYIDILIGPFAEHKDFQSQETRNCIKYLTEG